MYTILCTECEIIYVFLLFVPPYAVVVLCGRFLLILAVGLYVSAKVFLPQCDCIGCLVFVSQLLVVQMITLALRLKQV